MTTKRLKVPDLRMDAAIQPREKIDTETVREYGDALADGAVFPPAIVFFETISKIYWLADGWHRCLASRDGTVLCEVRSGGRREAALYAAQANRTHGLRRSTADKQRAVRLMLAAVGDDGEWSDRKIAEHCGVSQPMVSTARKASHSEDESDKVYHSNGDNSAETQEGLTETDSPVSVIAPSASVATEGSEALRAWAPAAAICDRLGKLLVLVQGEITRLRAAVPDGDPMRGHAKDLLSQTLERILHSAARKARGLAGMADCPCRGENAGCKWCLGSGLIAAEDVGKPE